MLAAVAVAGIGGAEAKVLRIVVERTEALAASVGAAALEKLRGRAYGEMDPGDPANAVIVDLSSRRATRTARLSTCPCSS
jgi:hypothetical protein